MLQPKVSIISPIHNPGKYLIPLLDSFCNQTLKDIEIILVDDGSTDGSRDILKEYEKKDERIQVILRDKLPNENFGQKNSVDAGLKIAVGEYVIIVDHDDELMLNALEKLYNATDNGIIDVVQGRNITINENNELVYYTKNFWPLKTVITDFTELTKDQIWNHLIVGPIAVWACLIKRKMLDFITLPDCVYNDVSFIWKLKISSNNFCYIPDYIYKQNEHFNSVSNKSNANKNELQIFKAFQDLELYLKQTEVNFSIWSLYSLYEYISLAGHLSIYGQILNEENYNKFLEKFKEEINRNIDISNLLYPEQVEKYKQLRNNLPSSPNG